MRFFWAAPLHTLNDDGAAITAAHSNRAASSRPISTSWPRLRLPRPKSSIDNICFSVGAPHALDLFLVGCIIAIACVLTFAVLRDEEVEDVFEDGTVLHTLISAAPLYDGQGRVRGAVHFQDRPHVSQAIAPTPC